jgi:hypothetical protein
MKDRKIGKGKEGREGKGKGRGRGKGRDGNGGEVCFMVLGEWTPLDSFAVIFFINLCSIGLV